MQDLNLDNLLNQIEISNKIKKLLYNNEYYCNASKKLIELKVL